MEICELQHKIPQHLPTRVKSTPSSAIDISYQLSSILLETLRHNYNEIFDYDSTSRFESLRGLLRPYHLTALYSDFGFEVLSETCQIRFNQTTRVGQFFDRARRSLSQLGSLPSPLKIYSNQHQELQDDDARFLDLCRSQEKSKFTTILITSQFNASILFGTDDSQGLIEPSHYITITDFHYHEPMGTVSFKFMTYGNEHAVECSLDDFKKHYLGAIAVDYNHPPQLSLNANPSSDLG